MDRRESNKKYYEKNKDYLYEKKKEYRKIYPEKTFILNWKSRGVKLREGEDWDSIYLYYITCEECENCGVELTDGKPMKLTTRCLDHDHSTGFIRNIICNACNIKRG